MPNVTLVEYAHEPWAMEPERLRQFMSHLAQRPSLSETLSAVQVEHTLPYRAEGGAGVIPIRGVLLKSVPGWLRLYGVVATGYDEIQRMVQMALDDSSVSRIEMRITSPGGMVAGGMETADIIRAADAVKPVTAVIEDLGASGAFWLACSARRIEANPNAEVGSIGVYTYYIDWTGFDEQMGVKTIVIRSGPHKGMGLDGVTDVQIAAMQEVIDGMASHFIDQVARGRSVSREQAAEWASGRIWLAPAAVELGLIDGLTAATPTTPTTEPKEQIMAEQTIDTIDTVAIAQSAAADAVATERKRVADLTTAFPTDAAFALEAIEAGWDVTQAKAERHDRMEKEAAATPKGVQPLPYNDSDAGDTQDFMAQVNQMAKDEKITKTEAMRRVQQDDPAAYAKFLASESQRPVRHRSGKGAAGRVSV